MAAPCAISSSASQLPQLRGPARLQQQPPCLRFSGRRCSGSQRSSRRRAVGGPAEEEGGSFTLDQAASKFAKGVATGKDAGELVEEQLGARGGAGMSDTQERYRGAIKRKLEQRAEELRRDREARAVKFAQGKFAYERGQYAISVQLLEKALAEEGQYSQLGGEVQLWLALAYQATGREEECLATYRWVEKNHPMPTIRRQASELKYIMEAPKLEISPEERVKIPVLTDLEANRSGRAPVSRPRPTPPRKVPKTWDEEFWENWQPPVYVTNRYVLAAGAALAAGLALYSTRLRF